MSKINVEKALSRCIHYYKAGRYNAADQVIKKVLKRFPNHVDGLNIAAIISNKTGDLDAALALVQRAIQLQPKEPNYISNLGAIYRTRGETGKAEEAFRLALLLDSDRAEFHFNLGQVLYDLNHDEDAKNAFERAIEINPNYSKSWNELGNCLRNLGGDQKDLDLINKSIECFRKIKLIDPGFERIEWSLVGALRERARLLLDTGDEDQALIVCEEIESLLSSAFWLSSAFKNIGKKDIQNGTRKLEILTIATEPEYELKSSSIKLFKDVRIFPGGKEWFVGCGDKEIHINDMGNGNSEIGEYVLVEGMTAAIIRVPDRKLTISEKPVFLIGGSSNYYHWILDYMPRLGLVNTPIIDKETKLIVNSEMASFQLECIDILGIDKNRLVPVPDSTEVKCDELFVTPIPVRGQSLHGTAISWLQDVFATEALLRSKAHGVKRLYVSRADAALRRVVNETSVIEALLPYGFKVVQPEKLSVAEQVSVFSEAEIIIAPHGAALTNVVFAPRGAIVVELSGGQRVVPRFFSRLCEDIGHKFYRVGCGFIPSVAQEQATSSEDQDMHVPVKNLLELLEDAGLDL
tara:strand:+ start:470 stop:2200 length:1731 start_codon:yes stop_codon:yes gene_type:complete